MMAVNKYDQPLGPAVASAPSPYPHATVIGGQYVSLQPLKVSHAQSLWRNFNLAERPQDQSLWTYLSVPVPATFAEFEAFIAASADDNDGREKVRFAIIDRSVRSGDEVLGAISYCEIQPQNRALEIGWLMFSHRLQRTPASTEASFLLLSHAFNTLAPSYRRVVWQCHSLNKPSARAAR